MGAIPLGEDILLARHGASIVKFRQDRKNRATVAYLRGGATDSASNLLSARALSPAESISRGAVSYLEDESVVSRQEVRSLVKISLGFSAVMGIVFGGLLLALYKVGGNEAIASLSTMGAMP
ncbi:hypothetical protein CQ017_05570 [Arthrobacter sp. MYb224]|uniref:hypothetical protein n=1 Tax=Micrococcaceae TaxID=1268 RepID=UPI000CFAD9F1|nr:hypothetical protein [Arthrobacter sp. MYb224]PRA00489.1 hypothetical protein CQ017_05570 [Arthrobacter sp. MYb224]